MANVFEFFEDLMENLDPSFQRKYPSIERPVFFGLHTPPEVTTLFSSNISSHLGRHTFATFTQLGVII
jgi:hypothetical protein